VDTLLLHAPRGTELKVSIHPAAEQLSGQIGGILRQDRRPAGGPEKAHIALDGFSAAYKLNSSRSRRVCARLTGISVCRLSFMRSW